MAAGDAEAAVAGDGDPAGQDLVAGPLDLVQDAAVQLEGDPDTRPGGGGEQLDARLGGRVVGPGPVDLEGQQLGDGRGGLGGGQVGPADPEALQVLRGQVDPAAPGSSAMSRMKLVSWKARPSWRACSRAAGGSADSRIGAIMVPITAAEPSM